MHSVVINMFNLIKDKYLFKHRLKCHGGFMCLYNKLYVSKLVYA